MDLCELAHSLDEKQRKSDAIQDHTVPTSVRKLIQQNKEHIESKKKYAQQVRKLSQQNKVNIESKKKYAQQVRKLLQRNKAHIESKKK